MSLAGLSVVTLESLRAELVVNLIQQEGGLCFNAPSVREIPLEENHSCLELVRALVADEYDALVLNTGVGLQCMLDAAESVGTRQELVDALGRTMTISRGPKSAAVLRRNGMNPTVLVPDPNTWREVLQHMKPLNVSRVAVQEYGVANDKFVEQLRDQGREVISSPVYRWDLPLDIEPLQSAVKRIAAQACDIVIFLSSVQLVHLLRVADAMGMEDVVLANLREQMVTTSIGPVMTDAMTERGLKPDFIPKHPKLAICIRQLAAAAPGLVAGKRTPK